MKALIQRVKNANVVVDGNTVGAIGSGILVLLGVEASDDSNTCKKLAEKVIKYRIFSDSDNKMNLNIVQAGGDILVVSQFTLVADTSKGNRPGFSKGATPELGEQLFVKFKENIESLYRKCESGIFGADMQVSLCNDGPVTFMLEAH